MLLTQLASWNLLPYVFLKEEGFFSLFFVLDCVPLLVFCLLSTSTWWNLKIVIRWKYFQIITHSFSYPLYFLHWGSLFNNNKNIQKIDNLTVEYRVLTMIFNRNQCSVLLCWYTSQWFPNKVKFSFWELFSKWNVGNAGFIQAWESFILKDEGKIPRRATVTDTTLSLQIRHQSQQNNLGNLQIHSPDCLLKSCWKVTLMFFRGVSWQGKAIKLQENMFSMTDSVKILQVKSL